MLSATIRYFWPSFKKQEVKKFSLLALTFFLIIGSYWLLRMLKNTIIYKIAFPIGLGWPADQGRLMQPIAKSLSPFVIIVFVIIYAKLVDSFKKETLFYILSSFYTAIFGMLSAVLAARHFFGDIFLGKTILAATGWIAFFMVESFGSLLTVLFWSFTSSICTTEEAKRGYPLIVTAAQLGAIIGSLPGLYIGRIGSTWLLFAIATLLVATIMPLIAHFMRTIPPEERAGTHPPQTPKNAKRAGFLSGLRLLFTQPYLIGIFIVSTAHDIITQIIEYQMESTADVSPWYADELGFARFQGIFGMSVNATSFFMALLGTSYLLRRFGLRFCLLFFPASLGIAILSLFLFFNLGNPTTAQILWSTFGAMILAKGLGYAVNNPTKEIMYIPTGKDVRFKTKSWIDMFGDRAAKQGGAQINNIFKYNLSLLMAYGTAISLGITVVWIGAAWYVGSRNKQLVDSGEIIQ